MTRLIDNNKVVEISIREWDEESSQYGTRPYCFETVVFMNRVTE